MRPSIGLKPQDILILLKLLSLKEESVEKSWRQIDLAKDLGLSQSEVTHALERLRRSSLIDEAKRKPQRLAAVEFLLHGVKYVFPAEVGGLSRGVPTARSAPPLAKRLVAGNEMQWVWAHPEGSARGVSVQPIYETAPLAALKDPVLYEYLALLDSLRVGLPRERKLAEQELSRRILGTGALGSAAAKTHAGP